MSTIIGIQVSSHDTTVAVIKDGKILSIYEEEKLTGIKSCYNVYAQPTLSLKTLEKEHGITLENCDYVALTNFYVRDFVKKNVSIIGDKIFQVSHHISHTLGAYFTSGMEGKVISFSHDGKGNRSRGKILLCENGEYEEIHSQPISTTASLAGLWASTTDYLGWKMLKDEGKVVGLAAHGKYNERFYKLIKSCIYYDGEFNFKPSNYEALFHYICDNFYKPEGVFKNEKLRADFAFCLQLVTEETMRDLFIDLKTKFPEYKKICLSGGLFANVKLNMFLNDLDIFDEIFIHPAMGDSGLALGSALKVANDLGEIIKPFKMDNVFLGEQHNVENWLQTIISEPTLEYEIMNYERVGELINNGYVVGLFIGKTEYGPRALGNRSIVVKPTDKETHEYLNKKLKRTEIMPFAPAVLEEYADSIFDIKNSRYTAEFMTICYDTKKEWIDKIPAVVHYVDGTARPQIVNKDRNSSFYNIISAYHQISGYPVVLNTSLNAHGEPINNYPNQVIKHLLDESIDYIVTENFIIKKRK
jgi:carbamoyltransferase